jgi:phosphoesterase RecJ-like protein
MSPRGQAKNLDILKTCPSFLVTTHVNPDPDALASQIAFTRYLLALGKKVYAVNAESVPERFRFFPGSRLIREAAGARRMSFAAAVIVDCGDFDRIGAVKDLIPEGTVLINIDHHITNTGFGDWNCVDPEASSTAEVIFDVLSQDGFPLNRPMATLLYLGIMTDTGSFRYDNTTPHTHEVVARLMRHDIPVSRLYRKLYETVPLRDLKNFTKLVSAFDSLFDDRVICVNLKKTMIGKFSEEFDLRDKIFRYLREIKGVEVLVILTETAKNTTRVNLRSQGKVDVAKLAYQFNGGGHSRASGCLLECAMEKAKQIILAQIKKALLY